VLLSVAALLLIVALCLGNGQFDRVGVFLAALGVGVSAFVALRREGVAPPASTSSTPTRRLLVSGIFASLLISLFIRSDIPAGHPVRPWLFGVQTLAVVLFSVFLAGRGALKRAALGGLLGAWVLAAMLILIADPNPAIDCWVVQQHGIAGLLDGRNPYRLSYPNIYDQEHSQLFYSSTWLDGEHVVVYPYPPLSMLFQIPFYLIFKDVRYASLLATFLGALLLLIVSQSRGQEERSYAVLLILFEPMTVFVIKQGWTEPLVFLFWAATVVVSRPLLDDMGSRPHRAIAWSAIALGLLAASKQYAPLFLVPPLIAGVPAFRRWRVLAIAAGVATAAIAPFFFWDPKEFVHDVVLAQFQQPLRLDALSLLAVWGRIVGKQQVPLMAVAGSFVAAAAIMVMARTLTGRLDKVTATSAAAWLSFVFLNKQAFCNYYWLGVSLLCVACFQIAELLGPHPFSEAEDGRRVPLNPANGLAEASAGRRTT